MIFPGILMPAIGLLSTACFVIEGHWPVVLSGLAIVVITIPVLFSIFGTPFVIAQFYAGICIFMIGWKEMKGTQEGDTKRTTEPKDQIVGKRDVSKHSVSTSPTVGGDDEEVLYKA